MMICNGVLMRRQSNLVDGVWERGTLLQHLLMIYHDALTVGYGGEFPLARKAVDYAWMDHDGSVIVNRCRPDNSSPVDQQFNWSQHVQQRVPEPCFSGHMSATNQNEKDSDSLEEAWANGLERTGGNIHHQNDTGWL